MKMNSGYFCLTCVMQVFMREPHEHRSVFFQNPNPAFICSLSFFLLFFIHTVLKLNAFFEKNVRNGIPISLKPLGEAVA